MQTQRPNQFAKNKMSSTFWILVTTLCLLHLQRCSAELKCLQVVFTHGSTTPNTSEMVYPQDPYLHNTFKPFGPAALTNKGQLSNYNFSEFLRKTYDQFLGPTYSPCIIQFYANELNRVIMSAKLVSTALFSSMVSQRILGLDLLEGIDRALWCILHPPSKSEPIPVRTEPKESNVLYNGIMCSKFKKLRENVEANDPKLVKRREKYKYIFSYLSENAGVNVTQLKSFYLNDILHSELDINLRLPSWTRPIRYILKELAAFDIIIQSYNLEMKKLMGGMWLREWLNHVQDCMIKKSELKTKAHVYAAQDIHVGAILTALNVYDFILPDHSSAIMLELHENKGKLYVKVLYKSEKLLQILTIPGCDGQLCSLEVFKKLVAPLIPDDPVRLCGKIEDNPF